MRQGAQGCMLGAWITGFRDDGWATLFSLLIAVCLLGACTLLGAGWLIMKAEGALQLAAVRWARACLRLTAVGVAAVSAATPLISPAIFKRWFSLPFVVLLARLPLATLLLFFIVERSLRRLPPNRMGSFGRAPVPMPAPTTTAVGPKRSAPSRL